MTDDMSSEGRRAVGARSARRPDAALKTNPSQWPPEATLCAVCPLRNLDVFGRASSADADLVQSFKGGERYAVAGQTIIAEKSRGTHLFTVLSGWVFRYRTLEGTRRQIINFGLPGDFLGLQSTLGDEMSHGIESLTPVALCEFQNEKLWSLYTSHPLLAFDITWIAAQEERTFEEQLLTLGQRTAFERIAFLLWHLFNRARDVGLVHDARVELPIHQQHIADTLGLSLVHVNKTLARIRESGALEIRDHSLHVLDEHRLIEMGRVDTSFSRKRPLL